MQEMELPTQVVEVALVGFLVAALLVAMVALVLSSFVIQIHLRRQYQQQGLQLTLFLVAIVSISGPPLAQ